MIHELTDCFGRGHDHRKSGFTFIEITVVIVIIGILAGIGTPKIMSFVEKTKE